MAEAPRACPDKDAPQVNHNLVHYPHQRKFNYLLETRAGDLMRVKRQSQNKFVVWILDKGTFSWEQIDNIGEFALFVSHNSSVCFPANGSAIWIMVQTIHKLDHLEGTVSMDQ